VNEKVNCVKAGVAQGVANADVNTELDVSMCSGCLVDMSSNCGDVDYSVLYHFDHKFSNG
jgi:hypothetical protein